MFVSAGRIDDHGDALRHSAFYPDLIDAVHRLETRDDLIVRDATQRRYVLVTTDGQEHDGKDIRGKPEHEWFARVVGQSQAAHPASDLFFGVVNIRPGYEIRGHQR